MSRLDSSDIGAVAMTRPAKGAYSAIAEPHADRVVYYCASHSEDDPCVIAEDYGRGPLRLSYSASPEIPVSAEHGRRARAAVAAHTRRVTR